MSLASYGYTDDDDTLLRISSTIARSTTHQVFAIMVRKDVTNRRLAGFFSDDPLTRSSHGMDARIKPINVDFHM
jgi:hypothetical protein